MVAIFLPATARHPLLNEQTLSNEESTSSTGTHHPSLLKNDVTEADYELEINLQLLLYDLMNFYHKFKSLNLVI